MALFRECFWCIIKIVREKDKTEWMQKEDNIAGEMMQERFCAVFSFCIIHVFIQILQNFSRGECQIMATKIETNTLFSRPFIHILF